MTWASASRLTLTLCVVTAVNLPAAALAHPSDYSTLTLDFLFGPRGLEAIDAALVESEGGGYEPFPSQEARHRVAVETLRALSIPMDTVSIDARDSPRYHQVGFLIRFEGPSHPASRFLRIETAPLWNTASDFGLDRLKVSVCGVGESLTTPDRRVLDNLQVRASRDGRIPQGLDRGACTVWELFDSGDEVHIEVGSSELPETGPTFPLALAGTMAFIVLGIGVAARKN